MSERATVSVGCRLPGGLTLSVTERNPRTGDLRAVGVITLAGVSRTPAAPGAPAMREAFTTVDKELFGLWATENAGGSLLTSGAVFLSTDKPAPPIVDPNAPKEAEKPVDANKQAPVKAGDADKASDKAAADKDADKAAADNKAFDKDAKADKPSGK